MAQESTEKGLGALTSLLSNSQAFITYQPLRTEVALDFLPFPTGVLIEQIPARASLDPHQEATRLVECVGDRRTVMFIPGRKFDVAGTRYGQGGGWYDRFLALVPRTWLRIGVCYDNQLSPTLLTRAPWDQAMDYLYVVNAGGTAALYSSESGLVL